MDNKKLASFWMVAFSYVAAFVGAGFISGQELVQFFIRFGFWGLVGWVLVVLIMIFGGGFVIEKLSLLKLDSFHQFVKRIFGEKFAAGVNLVINGYLLGGLTIMLAGAGNLFSEIFKLPYMWGVVAISLLVFFIIIGKSNRLLASNRLLVPILIVLVLIISIKILLSSKLEFILGDNLEIKNPSPLLKNWFISVLLYLGYNAIGAIVAVINISKNTSSRTGKIGGLTGGVIIGLLGSLLLFTLLITYPLWIQSELPLVFILKEKYSLLYPIFAPCMIIAMFNVAIAYAMGISNYLQDRHKIDYGLACILVILVSTPLTLFGFSKLLGIMYPFFGILATILMLYIVLKQILSKLI
jgi:uncharacterized membrane protein YkvI